MNKDNIEILLCESEKEIMKDLELELIRAYKDGELVFDEDDLEIFNETGIF